MMKRYLLFALLLLIVPFTLKAQAKKSVASKSTAVSQTVIERGKVVYANNCLTCHQADGSGVPRLNPPLIKNQWVLGKKSVLAKQILYGSQGKIEIEGETFSNTMPALPQLTDQQIADVITYVRNSFGNKASAMTSAEVKAVRSEKK